MIEAFTFLYHFGDLNIGFGYFSQLLWFSVFLGEILKSKMADPRNSLCRNYDIIDKSYNVISPMLLSF